MDFWYQNGAKLVSKWRQKSMLTSKGRFYKNIIKPLFFLMIFEVSGVEVGSKNRSKIDVKIDAERERLGNSILMDF